jgi:hypothetical protein
MSTDTHTPDVVVYIVREDGSLDSWGRDTFQVAHRAVHNPPWPARPGEVFLAVDDWGHGQVVAALDENLLGLSKKVVVEAFTRVRANRIPPHVLNNEAR